MHEAALSRRLLTVALERADSQRAQRVVVVRCWIADSEPLSPESIAMHFAAQAAGTPAHGATLDLRIITVQARCQHCGTTFAPQHHLRICPSCGYDEAELLGVEGVGIDSIDIESGPGVT